MVQVGNKVYDYDAFGVEKSPDEMDVNPWRYCGEYYDVETGTVYLRARYYNPTLGRFTSEDPAGDGLNWYTYCANNPVGFVDPWGLAKVNTVDYAIAMGGTVEYYTNTDGKKCVRITANGITQGYICNSGKIDDTVLNATFGWSFLTDDHRAAGFGIAIIEGKLYLDITDTLYDRMNVAIKDGQSIWVPVTLYWFYKQMNHMGDWDIKESDSWNKTLGKNTFPGNDAKVFFAGMLFDPPALGNFTYGYIGAGVGIPQVVIAGGSAFAEVTSNLSNPLALFKPDNIKGELRGQYYAALGYLHYYQVTVNNILSLVGGKR